MKREDSGMSHTRKEERKQTGGCYRFYGNVPVAATTSLEVSVRWWYIRNIFQLQALKSPHIDVRSSDLDDDTVPYHHLRKIRNTWLSSFVLFIVLCLFSKIYPLMPLVLPSTKNKKKKERIR